MPNPYTQHMFILVEKNSEGVLLRLLDACYRDEKKAINAVSSYQNIANNCAPMKYFDYVKVPILDDN